MKEDNSQKEKVEKYVESIIETQLPAINATLDEINAKLSGFKETDDGKFAFEELDCGKQKTVGVVSVAVFFLEMQAKVYEFLGDFYDHLDDPPVMEKIKEYEIESIFYNQALKVLEIPEDEDVRDQAWRIAELGDPNEPKSEIVLSLIRLRDAHKKEVAQ